MARYALADPSRVDSPALLYYPEIIRENIRKAIRIAGSPGRIWPHIKTHKLPQIVGMQRAFGIERFKCATIAEAEMLGMQGVRHVLIAYPLIGPAVPRFLRLIQKFPDTGWWACVDSEIAANQLADHADKAGLKPNVLADVNMGMNRTGVALSDLEGFYTALAKCESLRLRGMHCYDGHIRHPDPAQRRAGCEPAAQSALEIRARLQAGGFEADTIIMGGTPTFPCHASRESVYLSPGTLFVNDHGYSQKFADLPFTPAAALLARVISRPAPGLFTLDLGHKAISADPQGVRGIIISHPQAKAVMHSEEHWVFSLDEDDPALPAVGQVLYVLPTHICSTNALYDQVLAVEDGKVTEVWQTAARGRKITI
ncbi:MAG: D-TA family PLP-dependent enzyme [Oscillospiraceae bacterium]|nr:D-TA family PLP-dependent enzyme [Oscillospiraceae bacterium]